MTQHAFSIPSRAAGSRLATGDAPRAFGRVMLSTMLAVSSACGGSTTSPGGVVDSVAVAPPNATVDVGGTALLQATALGANGSPLPGQHVFWNTENPSVATVSEAGVVTGVAPGDVRIAASAAGKSGFASVTVRRIPVATVVVTPSLDTVVRKASVRLHATLRDASGNELTGRVVMWSSNHTDVASVDDSGVVRGNKSGKATITATSEGKSGKSTIVVIPPPTASLTVIPTTDAIGPGQTVQLVATAYDASGAVITDAVVTWSSSDGGVATVSTSGLVRGVKAGVAVITAHSGTASAASNIVVGPVAADISGNTSPGH